MSPRVILLVSNPAVAREIRAALETEGCSVELPFDSLAPRTFDFLIADRLLPEANAEASCRYLHHGGDFAVLTLDRGSAARWVIAGRLEMASSLEVLARLGKALHRLHTRGRPPARVVAFEDVEVDFERGHARKGESVVSLRAKELDLLRRLVDNSPAVIPRDELLLTVWAYQDGVSTRTVDVHMSSLRRKLEDNPRRPKHLRTVRGVGYRFVA